MTVLDSIAVRFTADDSQLRQRTQGLVSSLGSLQGIVGTLAGGAMVAFVRSSLNAADGIRDLAIRTGASTEFLSQMQHAAKLTGVSFEAIPTAIEKIQRSITLAVSGNEKMQQSFADLNIDIEQFKTLTPDEQFTQLAAAIGAIDDPAKRTAVSMDLMGRGAGQLKQLFAEGAGGIAAMRAEADSLNLTITRDQADAADAANDSIAKLTGAFQGFGRELALTTAGPLADILTGLGIVIPRALNVLLGAFQGIGNAIGGIMAGISLGLEGNFSGALATIRDAVKDSGDQVFTPLKDAFTKPIAAAAAEAPRKIADAISGSNGQTIADAVTDQISDGIDDAADEAGTAAPRAALSRATRGGISEGSADALLQVTNQTLSQILDATIQILRANVLNRGSGGAIAG